MRPRTDFMATPRQSTSLVGRHLSPQLGPQNLQVKIHLNHPLELQALTSNDSPRMTWQDCGKHDIYIYIYIIHTYYIIYIYTYYTYYRYIEYIDMMRVEDSYRNPWQQSRSTNQYDGITESFEHCWSEQTSGASPTWGLIYRISLIWGVGGT